MRSFFVAAVTSFAVTAALCAISAVTVWLWHLEMGRTSDLPTGSPVGHNLGILSRWPLPTAPIDSRGMHVAVARQRSTPANKITTTQLVYVIDQPAVV